MKLNWGFGIAAVYILFAASMILFAVKASQQSNDLVTEHYYDEAVKYQQKIDAGRNALIADDKLSVNYLANKNAIKISAEGKLKNISGTLSFYRPDNAGDDFQLSFSTGDSGTQMIPLKKLSHGNWKINVAWNVGDKNCYTEQRIFVK